jgi:hypothetical protein
MSIDKATVDNACTPASNDMSIDNATVDNACAPAPASNAMSIINPCAPASNAMSINNPCAPASNAMSINNPCAPAINATSIDKAIIDKAGASVGSDSSALKDIQDLIANEAQSKVSDGSQFSNHELEAESFLQGITNIVVKWQELISKWLAFEKDYPIKGVIFSFL